MTQTIMKRLVTKPMFQSLTSPPCPLLLPACSMLPEFAEGRESVVAMAADGWSEAPGI